MVEVPFCALEYLSNGELKASMSHEDFSRDEEMQTGSDRGFGLTVGGILMAIACIRGVEVWSFSEPSWYLDTIGTVLLSIGSLLFILALIAPSALSGLNRAWMKLGLLLSKIVTPIVMGLIFFTTVTPIGLLMRLFGKDLLNVKADPNAKSYWVERSPPGPAPDSIKNQF